MSVLMLRRFLFILLCLMLTGCAPRVRSIGPATTQLATLAILPSKTSGTVGRERLLLMDQILYGVLRSRGYTVIDPATVRMYCEDSNCVTRQVLARRHDIAQFVQLTVDSSSENNFVAGYVNSISGSLAATDSSGKELLLVKHTASDTGGLIFYTGQVVQGILSQIENAEVDPFRRIAERYIEELVEVLPKPSTPTHDDEIVLEKVQVQPIAPRAFQICATGSAGMQALVRQGRLRTNLLEVAPGEYCGGFLFERGHTTEVELRNALGRATRTVVALGDLHECQLTRRAIARRKRERTLLTFGCEAAPDEGCMLPNNCKEVRFTIYRSEANGKPFVKTGTVLGTSWQTSTKVRPEVSRFEIVPLGPLGPIDQPIPVRWSETVTEGNAP